MNHPKKKKGARKLWGKVSSFVIKKMKRGSSAGEQLSSNQDISRMEKDTANDRAGKRSSIFDKKTKSSPSLFSNEAALVEETLRSAPPDSTDKAMANKKDGVGTVQHNQVQFNLLRVKTNEKSSDAKQRARPTSPSSYLLHSTMADRIHELAEEHQIQSPNRALTTQDGADIRRALEKIALDKLEKQKEILLGWESSTHAGLLKNADVQNSLSTTDPIDSLLENLGEMETKLGEIESRLIPQSKALKRAILPLQPISEELNMLLTHYQNKKLLSERLKYIVDKMEMNVEETSALSNVMKHIPAKRVSTNTPDKRNELSSNDSIEDILDADEDAIGIVASALKKLDGIEKDLHPFKDMVAVQEAESVIRKKLEALDNHIAHNLFTKEELLILDNHAKNALSKQNDDSSEMETEYSKIRKTRPNLVFLYKMLHQPLRNGGAQR